MAVAEIRLKKWTRQEWHRLIDLGVLSEDDRLELLDGDIVEMTPQSELNAGTVRLCADTLRRAFGDGYVVSSQLPIALDPLSEPQPDVSVARGSVRDFLKEHPADPVLLVEVSRSSLAKDRDRRASLYARAKRPEYWIVDLEAMVLEVYRDPVCDGKGFYGGWSYPTMVRLAKGDQVVPLALPGVSIAVADMLP